MYTTAGYGYTSIGYGNTPEGYVFLCAFSERITSEPRPCSSSEVHSL